jgi:hypothetical protein
MNGFLDGLIGCIELVSQLILYEPKHSSLRGLGLYCKVTREKLPAVLLNYKECRAHIHVFQYNFLPRMSAMQKTKLLDCLQITSSTDGFHLWQKT